MVRSELKMLFQTQKVKYPGAGPWLALKKVMSPGMARRNVPPGLGDWAGAGIDQHARTPTRLRRATQRLRIWASFGIVRTGSFEGAILWAPDPFAHIFRRGSSASRRPSPKRLKARTLRKMAAPGKRQIQGLISRIIRPALRSQPQLGVGGCVPSPRKLSEASAMIDVPTLSVEVTMRGAMQLGRICRHSKRGSRTARALAASMYVRALTESTLPRTIRA